MRQTAHVSSMKKTIRSTTKAEYIDPMPYAHLQLARATKKPKAKGDKKGETIKPIVHMFSCG